ncbi:MAG: type IV toxin-antitoxin system AbiEi family antitoxin domain-containing protein [Oceanipulchritudo sp.]
MKYEELLKIVPAGGVFRTGHLLAGKKDPAGVRRQLDRWEKSGRVRQLRRGVYQLPPLPGIAPAHPFVVANALKKGSYVSLQSVLSEAGMIPEHVPVTTSVTTGRPEVVDTPSGRYQYRHVAVGKFWGFREREVVYGQTSLVATPYKALLDLLYLTPHSDDPNYLDELRLEPPDGYEPESLDKAVRRMGSLKVQRAVELIKKIWEES